MCTRNQTQNLAINVSTLSQLSLEVFLISVQCTQKMWIPVTNTKLQLADQEWLVA